jgi:MFS family permease
MTLAMALGPVVGLWLMGDNSYDTLFLSSGGLTVAALVAAAMEKYPTLTTVKRPLAWEAFFERRVFHVYIAMFFATVTYGGIVSFITLYSEEIGIRNGGLFFLIYAIALSLTRPIAGILMDRHGPSPVIMFSFILLIAGFLSLWANHQLAGFAMAAVLIGIGKEISISQA